MAWNPSDVIGLAAVGVAAITVIANVFLQKRRLRHERDMLDDKFKREREDKARALGAAIVGKVSELTPQLRIDVEHPDDGSKLSVEDVVQLQSDLTTLSGLTDREELSFASVVLAVAIDVFVKPRSDEGMPVKTRQEAFDQMVEVYQIFYQVVLGEPTDADIDRLRAIAASIMS